MSNTSRQINVPRDLQKMILANDLSMKAKMTPYLRADLCSNFPVKPDYRILYRNTDMRSVNMDGIISKQMYSNDRLMIRKIKIRRNRSKFKMIINENMPKELREILINHAPEFKVIPETLLAYQLYRLEVINKPLYSAIGANQLIHEEIHFNLNQIEFSSTEKVVLSKAKTLTAPTKARLSQSDMYYVSINFETTTFDNHINVNQRSISLFVNTTIYDVKRRVFTCDDCLSTSKDRKQIEIEAKRTEKKSSISIHLEPKSKEILSSVAASYSFKDQKKSTGSLLEVNPVVIDEDLTVLTHKPIVSKKISSELAVTNHEFIKDEDLAYETIKNKLSPNSSPSEGVFSKSFGSDELMSYNGETSQVEYQKGNLNFTAPKFIGVRNNDDEISLSQANDVPSQMSEVSYTLTSHSSVAFDFDSDDSLSVILAIAYTETMIDKANKCIERTFSYNAYYLPEMDEKDHVIHYDGLFGSIDAIVDFRRLKSMHLKLVGVGEGGRESFLALSHMFSLKKLMDSSAESNDKKRVVTPPSRILMNFVPNAQEHSDSSKSSLSQDSELSYDQRLTKQFTCAKENIQKVESLEDDP